ncbi:hypothetical protein LTR36_010142 [Oleoguttula mirabilis]|uniref:DNA2/NAM7 helicase-like C-terminal domain-containing protein n=1 Tax=Oleoguttula mirabilis TaxID=1507867 RepID=A0AAV9JTE2_9PEZI|nr:hypothetical protein LTR36_010142 [Oleoguttula mirabilis]
MAAAFRDSDDEPSPPPSPTLDLRYQDPRLYEHLPALVDGVTKGSVTSRTTLVALYDYTDGSIDNVLLRNLTGVAAPAVPCQLKVPNGFLPPTLAPQEYGYELKLTYNKLLLAPAVRLQCEFAAKELPGSAPYLTLVLEWHFNDYDGSASGIEGYTHDNDGVVRFSAGPATCSGFNKIGQHREKFNDLEWQVVYHLKTYLKCNNRRNIEFRLHDNALPSLMGRAELLEIRARLPGGTGLLLPTIGSVEYAAFGHEELVVHSKRDGMRRAKQLMSSSIKHAMVPLDCADTFSTIKEAGVQLAYSATIADAESREALKLWAAPHTPHKGRLFAHGNFAALGVRFGRFGKLGSIRDEVHYRLPRELQSKMLFQLPGSVKDVRVDGFLMSDTSGLPSHDAIFLLTSKSMEVLSRHAADPTSVGTQYFDVQFTPAYNSFTYASQLDTVARLQREDSKKWHGGLLNQAHDLIPDVDLTSDARISAEIKANADAWLHRWMDWNAEQLRVIDGIKKAKGGAVIVMGPAGTGKTLLQQALAIYFWKLGYHVLALAPANSNADHLAKELDIVRARDQELQDLKFCRLYPGSRDFGLQLLEERQAVKERVGGEGMSGLSFHEFLVALEELKNTGWFNRPYGVVEIVVRMALLRKLKLKKRLRDDRDKECGAAVDSWEILREFIQAYQTKTFDPRKKDVVLNYRRAYQACKGHVISLSRFMITTTGNVRAAELLGYWTSHEYGGKCLGVMVFVDEAAKDVEANVWGGIVCETWASLVKGVFMFGDDRQLKPTNTSSKDKVQFNAYSDRLDVALPCRLVREGFPCFRLLEQRRMHWVVASFPNANFYDGKLRNGPGANERLDDIKPGFKRQLEMILAGQPHSNYLRQKFMAGANEEDVRLVWIEVKGERRMAASRSMLVQEHVDVFFNHIFPKLRGYFSQFTDKKDMMEENVMIICAYSATLYAYRDRINHMLARDNRLTRADMPRVLTVDSSQGDESFMVFFDGSFQHGDTIGFMEDPGRCNVAVTRAKEVFWMIGGDMQYRFRDSGLKVANHMTRYKWEVDADGRSHRFR